MTKFHNHCYILPIVALSFTLTMPSSAATMDQTPKQASQLESLAKLFVERLEPIYTQIDSKKKINNLSYIPDNTTLLLKPRVNSFEYPGDIYSIKANNRIYLSLTDVIDILELAIDFDEDEQVGSGWFLREDWPIDINLPTRTITSRGQTYNIQADDLYREDGILFISGDSLGLWTDMAFDYDLSQQYLLIESAYPLPAVARDTRNRRKVNLAQKRQDAALPRHEKPLENFELEVAEVSAGLRYNKSSSGNSRAQNFANIATQGQILEHDSYLFASRDSDDGLTNIISRFSRQSEDPDLLGGLNARLYEFGDVNSTTIPLTGNTTQALGFRATNNSLDNSDFNTTNIEGDSTPGWDIELYRNGVVVGSQVVDDNGRYDFTDIALFSGDNDFEIFFFGPQGEIRKETLSIPVTAALLKTQEDSYEFSVNLEDEQTFQENRSIEEDRGTLHIAGRYNKFWGDTLGYAGFRSRSLGGERKTFLSTGLTSILGPTIVDSNFAIDDAGSTAVELGARQRINDWDLALNAQWNSDEFITDETTNPSTLSLSGSAQRPFKPLIGQTGNILASANYTETVDGNSFTRGQLGISNQINRINISNNLFYEKFDGTSTLVADETLENSLALRGTFGKAFIRAGLDYDILPEAQVDRYFTQVNYRHKTGQSADIRLEHEPDRDISRGRLNLNYTNDHFRTSPFIEVNTDDQIFAGLNMNFSLLDIPEQPYPETTSERLIGRGLVTGFVYHDKDGNLIFDGDDEILPEVMIESVNSRKRARTNNSGYALLKGLPPTRATDIILDESSLPDSFMISATKGNSVFPVAGQNFKLNFPVHLSGEIEGTVYVRERDGSSKTYGNKTVELISLDTEDRPILKAEAAFDGFFLFTKVPPGRYLMTTETIDGRRKVGNPTPSTIEIGYDGSVIYAEDINLTRGRGFVPYRVAYNTDDIPKSSGDRVLKVKARGQSELGNLIGRFVAKTFALPVLKTLQHIDTDTESDYDYYTTSSPQKLHDACGTLSFYNIECSIVIKADPKKDDDKVETRQAAL